jgi:outer membrane protein TolC
VAVLSEEIDSLIARALRERPDLAAMRAEYDAARGRIRAVRGERLPSLTAGGSAGLNYRSGQSGGSSAYVLTIGLRIPLFNGFIWEYNQQQAEAQAEAALARAVGFRQQVIYEVFQSYYTLQTAAVRVGTADDLLASASESAAAARGRYEGGVGSLLELLSAEEALASARAQRIQARLGWQAALVRLARDAGLLDLQGRSPLRLIASPALPDSSQ